MSMTKEKRAELRKLATFTTRGPWTLGKMNRDGGRQVLGDREVCCVTTADLPQGSANARYITAANPEATLSLLDALDAAEAAKQCIPPAGETPIEGLPGHSIIIRHHPELASVEVEFAYPDTGGFVTFLADLPEMYAKETLQLKADLLDYSQQLGEMQTKFDAAEAEAGRLREVVERYKKAAEKAMPELSAMYNQLTGERLMRADPQHAVLIAYKMLEAARAAQGAPGGAGQ